MGIGNCFGKLVDDCSKGCTSVTEQYDVDAEPSTKFVCTKVTQAWLVGARAQMEYIRNRRFCPHCKLELPMLPRPMYAREHMDSLWKIEKDVTTKQKVNQQDDWSNTNCGAHIKHDACRSNRCIPIRKSPIY